MLNLYPVQKKYLHGQIQIQHLLMLNIATIALATNFINSNTTLVNVKLTISHYIDFFSFNSNTTLVNVKLFLDAMK